MNALNDMRVRYLKERPSYERVATEVSDTIARALRQKGIVFRRDSRAKECHSLLLKAAAKNKAYDEIVDKAGARVVLAYPDDRDEAAQAIRDSTTCLKEEDFCNPSDAKRFDYSGLHFDVQHLMNGTHYRCEVQLHCPGESLWACLAHDLIYKDGEAPYQHRRDTHRLRALTELFDLEATRIRQGLKTQSMAEEREILRTLLRHYLPMATEAGRSDLSLTLIASLKSALTTEESRGFEVALEAFVTLRKDKLERVFTERSAHSNPFMFQPESLLMFMLMDRDPTSVAEAWPANLPRQAPMDLALTWGVPAHDPDSLE